MTNGHTTFLEEVNYCMISNEATQQPFLHTTLAKKNWDSHAPAGTGAWSLKHTRACSFTCVPVSIFLARVVHLMYNNTDCSLQASGAFFCSKPSSICLSWVLKPPMKWVELKINADRVQHLSQSASHYGNTTVQKHRHLTHELQLPWVQFCTIGTSSIWFMFRRISREQVVDAFIQKVVTVIAEIFVRNLVLFISYFWLKVQSLAAHEIVARIPVYVTLSLRFIN